MPAYSVTEFAVRGEVAPGGALLEAEFLRHPVADCLIPSLDLDPFTVSQGSLVPEELDFEVDQFG